MLLAASLAPWVNLAAWTAYAEALRLVLGHYPRYMVEDTPASVNKIFDPLLGISFWLLAISLPFWFGITFWRVVEWNDKSVWRSSVVYLLGWAATVLVCTIDPVGFMKWFLD